MRDSCVVYSYIVCEWSFRIVDEGSNEFCTYVGIAMQLDIDEQLYQQLSQRAQKKGFDSAEEYSVVVLQTVVEELETSTSSNKIKDRLQDLGYLE